MYFDASRLQWRLGTEIRFDQSTKRISGDFLFAIQYSTLIFGKALWSPSNRLKVRVGAQVKTILEAGSRGASALIQLKKMYKSSPPYKSLKHQEYISV